MSMEKAARKITSQIPRTKTIEPSDAKFFSPMIISSTRFLLSLFLKDDEEKTVMLRCLFQESKQPSLEAFSRKTVISCLSYSINSRITQVI